jgi:sugar lactone lactonase YvrE
MEGRLEHVWGQLGLSPGSFQKPRAMAIDEHDRLFIVDKAARIQVFNRDGKFSHGWSTPEWANGKPTGLSFDNDGNLMVADTHYFRILFYTPEGELIPEKTFGEEGYTPGKFGWVTDAVQDSKGNYYVAEYGELDRIQKFSPAREFLFGWGGHGNGPLQFKRPQNLAIDELDRLWVVDACNHRVLVYDASSNPPVLVKSFGEPGSGPGQLHYPYDLVLTAEHVYICEFGNHRIQKFTREGQVVGAWGTEGRGEGELHNPWAIVRDSSGRLHVLDTYNQRVQRIRL